MNHQRFIAFGIMKKLWRDLNIASHLNLRYSVASAFGFNFDFYPF